NRLTSELGLEELVTLCGHVPREELARYYAEADVVVLTSNSEGIPVTLMEAMAMERLVLAPAITGIPELVIPGKTGFLFRPGSLEDFLEKLNTIRVGLGSFDELRTSARLHVQQNFARRENLSNYVRDFIDRAAPVISVAVANDFATYATPVLQQIQLPIQRDRRLPV